MNTPATVLFTRSEHGGFPVLVFPPDPTKKRGAWRYKLETDTGSKEYRSFEALKRDLYGSEQNIHWTHDRYFRTGEKWALSKSTEPSVPTTVLFAPRRELLTIPSVETVSLPGEDLLTVPSEGINLAIRHGEITKLLFSGYRNTILRNNLDPEEVLQEVRLGLETRNRGKSRWDPSRAKFGFYVHMVAGCIINNMLRKKMNRDTHESTGILAFRDNGRLEVVDVREAEHLADCRVRLTEYEEREALESFSQWLVHQPSWRRPAVQTGLKILPHLYAGCVPGEICELTGLCKKEVSAATKALRAVSGPYFGR